MCHGYEKDEQSVVANDLLGKKEVDLQPQLDEETIRCYQNSNDSGHAGRPGLRFYPESDCRT